MRDHSFECVSHYGDQHVKESDLRDECAKDEDDIAIDNIRMVIESIPIEFSEHQHVLIQNCINYVRIENGRNDVTVSADSLV